MSFNVIQQPPPDVSVEERGAVELSKLVCKLRWIGLEEEARHLQMKAAAPSAPRSSLLFIRLPMIRSQKVMSDELKVMSDE